ncbi:hypothetical protein BOTBODRAFT_56638 [Botryobasidium botryosum FD-172 SS1]|uniref:Survival protein SurE-like phosphatase/nucleotidase domain-containing protein n=1 Tax=Botryobasidium botryosum (strain FD-172 SS1) TaxID=930990 RepID=A0A067MLW3_BOTB1|nr:hypothetical protein BOTBODRAFT_56638 [Botryobasidium botryosum FD-172 SS1]
MVLIKPLIPAVSLLLSTAVSGLNILLSNDDGWAVANIRALKTRLEEAGHKVIISAPSDNRSGTGNSTTTPTPIGSSGCDFGTCAPGSPAIGVDPNDESLWYVHAYPVDAVKYGISTLAPKYFGGPPDLILAGPNEGSNLGDTNKISGTFGAAKEGVIQGIPSIAFSAPGPHRAYTALGPRDTDTSWILAELAVKVVQKVVASGKPYLPANSGLGVNFSDPKSSGSCTRASSFKYVLTAISASPDGDPVTCGSSTLPLERPLIQGSGCYTAISSFVIPAAFNSDKKTETEVLDRLSGLLSCP